MALNEQHRDPSDPDAHDWAALVPRGHGYHRYVSDLSGFDPLEYDGGPESAISSAMLWLTTRPDAIATTTPDNVIEGYQVFEKRLLEIRRQWHGQVPWSEVLLLALDVAEERGLFVSDHDSRESEGTSSSQRDDRILALAPSADESKPHRPFRASRLNDRIPRLLVPFTPPSGVDIPPAYLPTLTHRAAEATRLDAVMRSDGSFAYPLHVVGPPKAVELFARRLAESHSGGKPTSCHNGDTAELWVEYEGSRPPRELREVAKGLDLRVRQCGATLLG